MNQFPILFEISSHNDNKKENQFHFYKVLAI